ncbi:riboflavin synthase [Yunchengibacter salinarum]|uniref:riboflavin synthase n=1 Tax=Yunchengibacter salinarum TaxID=3133399 RepID=UPI0035B68342
MFTGIVTDVGRVLSVEQRGDTRLRIATGQDLTGLEIGASIACSGVCLTVVDKSGPGAEAAWFAADVSAETLRVTALGGWREGSLVNLERSLKVGDELGGHIVAGHVDCVGTIEVWEPVGDSMRMDVVIPAASGALIAPKGSVSLDGVSLTVNTVEDRAEATVFSINMIPHTREVTAFRATKAGDRVNVELDVLARYVARLRERG